MSSVVQPSLIRITCLRLLLLLVVCTMGCNRAAKNEMSSPPQRSTGILTGVVRDASGRRVAGAKVWAICTGYGIRAVHTTIQTTTGFFGGYRIKGIPAPGGLSSPDDGVPIQLIAFKEGQAPAFGYVTLKKRGAAPDLVLSNGGASLLVRVLGPDGKPRAGVNVEAAPNQARIVPSPFYRGNMSGRETRALRRALVPHAVTNAAGTVRFDHLLPGVYMLRAAGPAPAGRKRRDADEDDLDAYRLMENGDGREIAFAQGVPVAPMEQARFDLRLQKSVGKLPVQFLLPDGTAMRGSGANLVIAAASSQDDENHGSAGVGGNENQDTFDFSFAVGTGIWRVTARLDDTRSDSPTYREPLLSGRTVIAYSPYRARREEPLEIQTTPVTAGKLAVQVVDEAGRPVRGVVTVGDYDLSSEQAEDTRVATTDKDGRVVLTGLESGNTWIRAEAGSDGALPHLRHDAAGALPPDKALTGRRRWPAVTTVFRPGVKTELTVRPLRVGWLRGSVHGAPAGSFYVPGEQERTLGADWSYDRKTGQYLIGPLPSGPFTLVFNSPVGRKLQTVTIAPGKVTRLDFAPEPARPDPPSRESAYRSRPESLKGSVFLPDGRTPASGAYVLLYDPAHPNDVQDNLWVNSAGQIGVAPFGYPRAHWDPPSGPKMPPPSADPREPVVIALLPGSHGAAIAPLPPPGQRLRLTLPPALSVRGRVTVAGRPFGPSFPGDVRVLAAPTDQGSLNDLLTIEGTAQSDGSFTLAGLTPGTYILQAALDNTWLSAPVKITIQAGAAPPSLTIDLPIPGDPLAVNLGKENAGVRVRLVAPPPSGPLSIRYLPAYYVADGAGRLRLEGLPAGSHRLRLPDGRILTVTVPRNKDMPLPSGK